ncbi:MAG: phenylalanine--tRNA ligase subunit alpha, partial [Chitinophagales bacterium]
MPEVVDQLFEEIKNLAKEAEDKTISSPEELEKFRIEYLGSKGKLKSIFSNMKVVPGEKKKEFGLACNALKQGIEAKFEKLQKELKKDKSANATVDLSLPGYPHNFGSLHPVTLVRNQIVDIFKRIGFTISEGSEIEDDFHNFTALNFPEDHPARDMQDT